MRKLVSSYSMAAILVGFLAGLQAEAAPSARANQAEKLSIAKVSLLGEGRGDYLFADPKANRLFVTHTSVVHVLDLTTLKPVAQVNGLTAAHGVALDAKGRYAGVSLFAGPKYAVCTESGPQTLSCEPLIPRRVAR